MWSGATVGLFREPSRSRTSSPSNELTGKTLALLPLGTGNDFARGTGIPLLIEEAARLVLDGEARPVDLIVDETGEIVVNNVHVGAGAQASRKGHK